ncbi:dihydrodipicolinate synthase family protein [Paraburkholderia aspalathi]|uniref:4-hydroxy-tetrahydrodipicolinate synthase n=1 Tax=Paraburkholderia aspalathi TaxID=1324617 RepID=A0A1I7ACT1_9BURK|nr:dihydrodipicolinate synthase family protein [Paraburkholderia aspalathi]SFT72762.1 4-hydroxy-tetrahydrodipicolinate synthase [Paraburkholderia aspalathi]
MNNRIEGIMAPLVTPLREDGSVCEDSVRRLIDSLRGDATALLPTLSSGEGGQLSRIQWEEMVRYTVHHAEGLPVYPGAIVLSDDELFSRIEFATQEGAAGMTVVIPPLGGDATASAQAHLELVLERSPLPLFLYHLGTEGDAEMLVDALSTIGRLPRVLGLKESSRRPEIVQALNARGLPCGILQGWEDLLWKAPGAHGLAVALANLEIGVCAEMWRSPTPAGQSRIMTYCNRYGLFDDDWYAGIKAELYRRGVLSTPLTATTACA